MQYVKLKNYFLCLFVKIIKIKLSKSPVDFIIFKRVKADFF